MIRRPGGYPGSGSTLRAPAHEVGAWRVGRCISFGSEIPYLPLIDLLKEHFDIGETDSEEEILARVETGAELLGTDLAASLPYLKYLLAVDPGEAAVATMDAQLRKVRVFEALRELLMALSRLQPLVVTVEDLHWIDPLSEEFLLFLAATVPHAPILLVLTYRRGYPNPFGSLPCFTQIGLQHLSERETAAVAQGLLGADALPLPGELQELIYRKAEGNPFFVEEVTKSLLEVGAIRRSGCGCVLARPIEEIIVPDTVQDVIMARLDRLAEEPKRAIQTAAVIGREFTVRLLRRTAEVQERVEAYLDELQAVELIYQSALYPELAFMFKHALTHDVAYNSLLAARRKVLHRLVGTAVEELYWDRLTEQYETLAHHFERAEAWEKALEYLQKSGEKALAAFAPQQAVSFFDRTLALLEKADQALAPERVIALHHGRGQALFLISDWEQSAASFQAMLEAAREAGDRNQQGLALFRIALTYFWGHRFGDAIEYAERARRLALATGNQAILAGSLYVISFVGSATGDLQDAREVAEEALLVSRQAGIPSYQGLALWRVGQNAHLKGEHSRALQLFDEALQIGRQHELPVVLLTLFSRGLTHCGRGDYERALQDLGELLKLSDRLGDKIWRPRALNSMGWVYMDLCHWELALQDDAQSAAEGRALGNPEVTRNAELNLADCYLALDRLEEAQRTLETVDRESQRRDAWGEEFLRWRYIQHLYASLAELWLARGHPKKALAFADACLVVAEATESRRNIVKGRRVRGEAFLAQGRLEEAETELREALRVAREVGNPTQVWKTLASLGRLRKAQGRAEEGRAAFEEALRVVENVAASLSDASLREVLLGSTQAAALREAAAAREELTGEEPACRGLNPTSTQDEPR